MSKGLGSPLVLLSIFISTLVSMLTTVSALWAVFLSLVIALMHSLLLYYYKNSIMYILVYVLYIIILEILRDSKSSLLSAGGISYWERTALWPLYCPRGDSWHISYFLQSLGGWSITVIDLNVLWTSMVTSAASWPTSWSTSSTTSWWICSSSKGTGL